MGKVLSVLLLLLSIGAPCDGSATGNRRVAHPEWGKRFEAAGVRGCFLLYDLRRNEYHVYNPERAAAGFHPASTFKLFNSLVALDTRVVRDEHEVLKWDGTERRVKAWNADTDMRGAFKNSTVWFYQEIARRVRRDRMRRYVERARYGNRNIGGRLDGFWLDGDMRITAEQQIEFLVRLHKNKLPFSRRTIDIVKEIAVEEKTDRYTLRAKTGWYVPEDTSKPQLGWWVGYVERRSGTYFFALNIDIKKDEDALARRVIAKSILRDMNVMEAQG